MKSRRLTHSLLAATLGIFMAGCASADHGHRRHHHTESYAYHERGYNSYADFGRVLNARPIYRQVAVEIPRESCRVQTVAHERRGDSFGGTLVGGLVGAAIGRELGHGRSGATAVGGIMGAAIGNEAGSRRSVHYRDQEVCSTHYRTEYEQRLVGYDVRYSYQGRVYQTRTDRHPGDRIAVTLARR
jgi:uncharacterized protein YcfJ